AATVTLVVLCMISWQLIIPAAYALSVALALGFWIFKRLGGLTGDVYGAAIELSELAFLIVCQLSLDRPNVLID
ncbi:MAG: Cobalamin synthase, partial [Pseudomonadota bacterium]